MHIDWIDDNGSDKNTHCAISHQGEVLEFSVSHFSKTGKQRAASASQAGDGDLGGVDETSMRLFHYHNQWFESLDPRQCDAFFKLYKQAREAFDSPQSHEDLTVVLRNISCKIVDMVAFDDVHTFIRYRTDIRTPASVLDEFDEGPTGRNRRDKTYTKKEYEKLVTLTFIMRLMLPVWGEMLESMKTYMRNAKMELTAFNLISNAKVMQSEAMLRLNNFIENTIPPDTNMSPALIEGIATVEYRPWIAALVVLRRLIMGKLQDGRDTTSLVSFIYKYIIQTARNNKFGGYIKDKNPQNNVRSSDGNEISSWEAYRVKTRWMPGDIAQLEHYLSDPIRVYMDLMGGMDVAVVEKHMPKMPGAEFQKLLEYPIGVGQRILLQYVVSLVGTHRLIPELSRGPIYTAMIAATHFLDAIGQQEIAGLMTSIEYSGQNVAGSANKHRRSFEQQALLQEHYPWPRRSQSKQSSVDSRHAYENAITAIEPHFNKGQWWLTLNDDMIRSFSPGPRIIRPYVVTGDFRILLTSYFVAIEERRKALTQYRQNLLANITV